MADVKPRIPYRQLQAQETKRRIAVAARRLFAEHGYATTSIESIAEEVGVAPRTVYAAFGTKKAILGAICDQWLEESTTFLLVQEAIAASDPEARLGLLARATRCQWERGVDIVAMLKVAAATDAEINRMLKGWKAERQNAMGVVLSGMREAFRPGMDVATASAITGALTGPEIFESLVLDSGWTPDAHEAWIHRTLVDLLLAPSSEGPSSEGPSSEGKAAVRPRRAG